MGIDMNRTCPLCGKELVDRHKNAIYCSPTCKTRAGKVGRYGLSAADYRTLIEDTGGKCPICLKNVRRWNVDHNHKTMRTTGIVCSLCNGYLLAFSDHDIERVERLLEYLKNPPVDRLLGGRVTRDYPNTPVGNRWNRPFSGEGF